MGKDASTIRQEIEQTRAQLGDTVEALAYKTDVPARVKDNVSGRVEAVKGSIGNIMDSVKTAVAGAAESVVATAANTSAAVDFRSSEGASTLAQARDTVNSTVAQARDSVGSTVAQARDSVNKTVAQAGDQLQNADISGNARRAVGAVAENPVGLAIAALAIGFLTGSLIPVSEAERKRIGPVRDTIVDQAQAATNDLVAAGKAVAFDTLTGAASAAKSSAQSHGQDVVDAAKARASEN